MKISRRCKATVRNGYIALSAPAEISDRACRIRRNRFAAAHVKRTARRGRTDAELKTVCYGRSFFNIQPHTLAVCRIRQTDRTAGSGGQHRGFTDAKTGNFRAVVDSEIKRFRTYIHDSGIIKKHLAFLYRRFSERTATVRTLRPGDPERQERVKAHVRRIGKTGGISRFTAGHGTEHDCRPISGKCHWAIDRIAGGGMKRNRKIFYRRGAATFRSFGELLVRPSLQPGPAASSKTERNRKIGEFEALNN